MALKDNQAIPDNRLENQDGLGRMLAVDVKVELIPVTTSARQVEKKKKQNKDSGILQLLSGLSISDSVTPCKASAETVDKAVITDNIKRSNQKKKKIDKDEDWVGSDTESEKEEESLMNDEYYDAEDEDDLAWACKNSDDEETDSDDDSFKTPRDDPFSPEHAKGIIEYTVSDSKNGSVQSVRRSARNSFCSPASRGRLSFGSPAKVRPVFNSPVIKEEK